MSLLLCKLRGKQPDKVRHKVLKMTHDKPSGESEKCKRRTRYEVHNTTRRPFILIFPKKKKKMKGDLGRPSRIGREQGKEIMSH